MCFDVSLKKPYGAKAYNQYGVFLYSLGMCIVLKKYFLLVGINIFFLVRINIFFSQNIWYDGWGARTVMLGFPSVKVREGYIAQEKDPWGHEMFLWRCGGILFLMLFFWIPFFFFWAFSTCSFGGRFYTLCYFYVFLY